MIKDNPLGELFFYIGVFDLVTLVFFTPEDLSEVVILSVAALLMFMFAIFNVITENQQTIFNEIKKNEKTESKYGEEEG